MEKYADNIINSIGTRIKFQNADKLEDFNIFNPTGHIVEGEDMAI